MFTEKERAKPSNANCFHTLHADVSDLELRLGYQMTLQTQTFLKRTKDSVNDIALILGVRSICNNICYVMPYGPNEVRFMRHDITNTFST